MSTDRGAFTTRELDYDDEICVKDVGRTTKSVFRSHAKHAHDAMLESHSLDARMGHVTDAEIEGVVDERTEERRLEMMEGNIGKRFPYRGSGLMLLRLLGHGSALHVDMFMFSGPRSNYTVQSAQREIVQSPQRERKTIIRPLTPKRFE
jgi:hypothetical protein